MKSLKLLKSEVCLNNLTSTTLKYDNFIVKKIREKYLGKRFLRIFKQNARIVRYQRVINEQGIVIGFDFIIITNLYF